MEIRCVPAGVFQANCYILKEGHDVLIIDPGTYRKVFTSLSADPEDRVVGILLTHGHFDHIGGVDRLSRQFQCPVYLSADDEKLARDEKLNSMMNYSETITVPVKDYPAEPFRLGNFMITVYFTPGHTDGSVCIRIGDDLFTGDTLFHNSIGRTDLYSGSDSKMRRSLNFLSNLEPSLRIHPGHEESSTIGDELRTNPYL